MKYFLTFILLLWFSFSFGQFAIVNDKDSLLNVREDGEPSSKVIDKLPNGQLIYCFENKGNWTNIDYTKKGEILNGYIYKNRYKLVSDFPKLSPIKKTQNSITLKRDTMEVVIKEGKFEKSQHTFKYVKLYPDQIELIDKKQYWGLDGGMPTRQFESITIRLGSTKIELPKKALLGLYEPNIETAEVNFDKATGTFYIQTMNSDGAGGYEVIWRVEKGVYKDRLIVYGF
jgi:hypothetical protein